MKLTELQERLKSEYVDGQYDMIMMYVQCAEDDQIRELSNIIISAKVKQPKNPQPVKYLTEKSMWSAKIEKAAIFKKEILAFEYCKDWGIDVKNIIPHNGGFIVTKPATK